jgi:hypothetical protein
MNSNAGDRRAYFVNLPVDFLLIGGGSIALFLFLPFFQDGTRSARVVEIGLWLTWIANWPHFAATSQRLYGRADHLRQYPITALAAPAIVAVGVGASLAWPLIAAPYFVKLFLLWSPYHYSGQSLGISLLSARRHQHQPGAFERKLLTAFIYVTFLMRSLGGEVGLGGQTYYGVQVPSFGVPHWAATAFTAGTYACAVALAAVLGYRWLTTRRAPPPMYLLPAATQYVWFVVAGAKPGYSEFVPFFHGLQYLVIAWAMQVQESANRRQSPNTLFSIGRDSLRWYGVNVALGVALFYGLPHLLTRTGIGLALASAVILTAIQIHHFFVDGVIWKLRTPAVVSPLLVNIPALIERPSLAVQPQEAAAA